jgi:hypothetical protein
MFAVVSFVRCCEAGTFPDFAYSPPSGWTGNVFQLSQNYPTALPAAESVPWKSIDFKTRPQAYLEAVIGYCFEGNIPVEFVGQNNSTRNWYHAPWLHYGNNGREFVRGLTRERTSRRFELAATQDMQFANFAVGFYNPRGAFTIGQVWQNPAAPDPSLAQFPEDTVSFKLLFTTATDAKVPYLAGSPEWAADIHREPDPAVILQTKVRLLQIDIAVKDSRSLCGGWVFGTFHYDSAVAGATPWEKLRPLSLMWGNDPSLTPSDFSAGQKPAESWVNPASPIVVYRSNPPTGVNPPRVMGWAGRANGPVDNPVSSCLSCHATGQIPAASGMIPPDSLSEAQKLRWFRNLGAGEPFDAGSQSLDFSLQLGVGIQNLQEFSQFVASNGGAFATAAAAPKPFLESKSNRAANLRTHASQQFRFARDPDEQEARQP